MTTTKTIYHLNPVELEDVLATIAEKGESAGVVELWSIVFAHDVRPDWATHNYAIPEAQWKVICQAMMDNPQHDGMPGGTMMNSGPSSYTD